MTTRRTLVGCLAALGVLTACGGGGDGGSAEAPKPAIVQLEGIDLPESLLGLRVDGEDIAGALAQVKQAYVEGSALFGMRGDDDLVQATLQVNRFLDEDRYRESAFRRTIVNQLGSSKPLATRMGDQTVWRTTGTNQAIAVWFEDRTMYLLAIRDDFDRPRSLIRELVDRA